MNLEKICEALSEVDELGNGSIEAGCAVGQLFYFHKKSNDDFEVERSPQRPCTEYFDGLLGREYGMDMYDVSKMATLNDSYNETKKQRCTRVLAHYEGLLIECLISPSSSPVEEELNHSEDVLIAQ